MTTAILVDDEPILLHHLKKMLMELWDDLNIVGCFNNGLQAWEACQQQDIDVVFTDIKMPVMDGLELATKLQDMGPRLVFITAYSEHAIQAFEKAAVDYVLKPLQEERLIKTIERLQSQIPSDQAPDIGDLITRLQSVQSQPKKYLKWLKVSRHSVVEIIDVEEVVYFEAADKYTTVKTLEHEYVIRSSLKSLELDLDPDLFWRVHRNTIVQVAAIDSVKADDAGSLHLTVKGLEKTVKISRRFAHLFKQQ